MNKKKNFFEKQRIEIPFFRPEITTEDRRKLLKSLQSHVLTNGPIMENFENKFLQFTKSQYAVAVSSATAALHLGLISMGIKKGDEVIVPNITFAATANVVLMTGATPVLADVDYENINILPESIEQNITKKTKAIIPVHFAGKACEMPEILKIGQRFNLKIIEDCAHAIGSKINNKHVGNFGNIGCFSFYPTKNITTLEGGMLITNNKKNANEIRILRNHGINRTLKERYLGIPWEYDIQKLGYNYRIDEIRSTLGISQLTRLKKNNLKRQESFRYYYEKLKNIDGIILPSLKNLKDNACHLFVIKINEKKFGKNRNYVFKKLLESGISTSVHYKPLNKFSIFTKVAKKYDGLQNSEILYNEILSLPLYSGLPKRHQDIIVKAIVDIKKNKL